VTSWWWPKQRPTSKLIPAAPDAWTVALASAVCALVSAGCATALSTGQPAHVAEVGHFSSEVGVDLSVSVGAIDRVVAAAESLTEASSTRMLTDDEKRTIFEGGAHLGFNPPAVIPHAGVYYVPFASSEVGLRFSASGLRLGVRRQILAQDTSGVDFTIGAGVDRSLFPVQINSDSCTGTCVHGDSYERWNVDASAVVGRRGSWYRWWAGPRLLYSHLAQSMTLTTPTNVYQPGVPSTVSIPGSVDGHGFYIGGCAGAVLGYRNVFFGPELTIMGIVGDADVTALGTTANVSLDSVVLAPAFAVMGEL
jgi:hypothetical protein